jgi:hypothetical protein
MFSFEGACASSAPAPSTMKTTTVAKSNTKASSVAKLPKKEAKAKPTGNKDQNKPTAGGIKAINGVSQKPWYKTGDMEVKSTLSPTATGVKTPWYKDPAIVPSGTSSAEAPVKETVWYKGQTPNTPTSGPQSSQSAVPWYKQEDSSKVAKSSEKPWYKIEDEPITFDESLYADAESLGPTSSEVAGDRAEISSEQLAEGEIELNLAPPSEEDALIVDEGADKEISESGAGEGLKSEDPNLELVDLPKEDINATNDGSLPNESGAEGEKGPEGNLVSDTGENKEDINATNDGALPNESGAEGEKGPEGNLASDTGENKEDINATNDGSQTTLDIQPLTEGQEDFGDLNLEDVSETSDFEEEESSSSDSTVEDGDEEITEPEATEGGNTGEPTLELDDLPEEAVDVSEAEESLDPEPLAEGDEDFGELNLEDVSETSDLEEEESSASDSTFEDASEDVIPESESLADGSEPTLDLEELPEEADPELNLDPLEEEKEKSQDSEKKDTAEDVLKGLGSIKGTEDVFSFATSLLGNLGKGKSDSGSESSAPRATRASPPKQATPKTKLPAPQTEDEPELKFDDAEAEAAPAPQNSKSPTSSGLDDLKSRIKKVGDKEVITTAGGQNVVFLPDGTVVFKRGS